MQICEFADIASRFDLDPVRFCEHVHVVAAHFAVEETVAQSEPTKRPHERNCRATAPVAE